MVAATEANLRLLCDDNPLGSGTDILTAAQYTALLVIEADVYRAASLACRTIAATFSTKMDVRVGGAIDIKLSQKFDHYMALANEYEKRANSKTGANAIVSPIVGGVSIADMNTVEEDTDRADSAFKRGMASQSDSSNAEPSGRENDAVWSN